MIDGDDKRRVIVRAEQLLRTSGAAGVLPTPVDELWRHVDVGEVVDISELPPAWQSRIPTKLRKLLGALVFGSRTVFIDRSQRSSRQTWTAAHECGHAVLPWHKQAACFDDEARLFKDSREQLEIEANYAAAHLLFQGERFFGRALDYRNSITTPIALAQDHSTSLHATIRYYTENHPGSAGLLITGKHHRSDGSVPIYVAAESATFRAQFGPMGERFGSSLQLLKGDEPTFFGDQFRQSRLAIEEASARATMADIDGTRTSLTLETFFNGYNHFVLLTPKSLKLGRRVKVSAA